MSDNESRPGRGVGDFGADVQMAVPRRGEVAGAGKPPVSTDAEAMRTLLSRLTPQRAKVEAYLGDTYVLESVEQLSRLRVDPATFATGHSLLLLKPDAIVARAVEQTLKWLSDNGYRVIDAAAVPVDRHLVRALWYYAWNIASPERRRLADLLVDISDALVLVVTGPDGELPIPVRLAAAKCTTDPRQRKPGGLRCLLGRHNYLLNLVHTPDDPADVLRELAVYFPEARRAQVVVRSYTGADGREAARAAADRFYARTPARSFDRSAALDRVLRAFERDGAPIPRDFDPGSDTACAALLAQAWAEERELDPWSVIVLGSCVLPMRVGTQAQTLRPVTASDWLEGRK
ncbi:nucleoside-diphosphate kinase [Nocardia brevicatena]|uniref:nucleoside-diphosphate kinase n=1 Tax=Nocardia brevicatena TaxID=37327 RepID=UPI0002F062D6|nr:nucleoside-diphosphate kinase [Nocardia brevicatena]